jgi:hypothetical protein
MHLTGTAAYLAGPAAYLVGPAAYLAGTTAYLAGPAAYLAGPAAYQAGPAPYPAGCAAYTCPITRSFLYVDRVVISPECQRNVLLTVTVTQASLNSSSSRDHV